MNILMNLPLFMAGAEGATAPEGSGMMNFAMIGAMILIFYFLIMRPQSKKQKETKKMLEAIKKGDKVTSIGGIRGTVDNIKDDIVTVRVNGDTKIDFIKSAISAVVNPVVEANKDTKDKKETKEEK